MFEELKKNIEREKKIIREARFIRKALKEQEEKKDLYTQSIRSLLKQLNMLNKAIPYLLEEEKLLHSKYVPIKLNQKPPLPKKLPTTLPTPLSTKTSEQKTAPKTVQIKYISPNSHEEHFIALKKADKNAYLEQLKISEESLAKIKKMDFLKGKSLIKKANPFAKISNHFFRKTSEHVVPAFSSLATDLKKGNIRFLLSTYISMALFSATLSFLLSLLIMGVLIAINLQYLMYAWVPFVTPVLIFTLFYLYPASEASSVQKKIAQELPFATIHMAAIAGSDIEPTKIFKIIAASKEYPAMATEIKKVIAQVDIYGYDLVTSLHNVSKWTPNKKLSELFSGLATNIYTGGELKNFLEKKAENFLLDYKLERKRYTDLAGTFMDIYISILIAAPLILMMMFIVMNVAGLGLGGLGIPTLMVISIGGIIIVNIIFLIVLNLKQPKV